MYADDLVILSLTKNGLQQSLNKLKQYTKKWGIELNLGKTKVMVFQRGGKRDEVLFYFGKNIIERTNEYKYLGTIMTENGTFKEMKYTSRKRACVHPFS